MTAKQEFGYTLRQIRKEARLTQAELALEIGRSQMDISIWERGKHLPTRGAISQLGRSFPEHAEELLKLWSYAYLEVDD